MKSLQSIQNIPVCCGCRKNGGKTNCEIRACASGKKLADCTDCREFLTCQNREPLQRVREGAIRVGMLAKAEDDHSNHQRLIEKWTAEIMAKCPVCGA